MTRTALSLSAKLGYGAGDYGLVLTWQTLGLFLLFFLTEVVGIDPATAGALIFVGLIWDGATDIAMGVIADRTRTRWGRYRPYLILGAPALAASFILLFWAPPLSSVALVLAALGAQLLFRLAFTIVAIPYGALSSAMTQDSRERGDLTGFRVTGSTLASLTVAVAVPTMVQAFGGEDPRRGYVLAASVIAAATVFFLILCFATTREQARPNIAEIAAYRVRALPSILLRNTAFLRVAACIFCYATGQTIVLTGMPYFFSYGRLEPDMLGPTLAALIGGVALFVPVWTLIARRIGKRMTWIIGAVWSCVAMAIIASVAQAPLPFLLLAFAGAAFGFAALQLASFAMLPDTVEFGAWRTGVRVEAGLFSALTLAQKAAAGLAAWLVGVALAALGHSAETPLTNGEAQGFAHILFVAPIVFMLFSLAAIWRYPISADFHARLLRALNRRSRHQEGETQ